MNRLIAVVSAALLCVLALQVPQQATAAPAGGGTTAAAEPVCGKPKPGEFTCFAVRRTDVPKKLGVQPRTTARTAAAGPEGYAPADLLSAYGLPADGGAGATVAIVDAYDNPNAEADLAIYRKQYGLPACTTENGCFRKVDQRGGADYPQSNGDWAGEISLDVDMVSAVAPKAHILLVEADGPTSDDLGTAVNTAVELGAKYVSNSYGAYSEDYSNRAYDEAYFNHPGAAIVASSADSGYGVSYPASSPYVTAVGGTSLNRDNSGRGWSEKVWNSVITHASGDKYWGAPGSGCSEVEPKPSFQTDSGCDGRSVADVSAVADPATGVAVYNSFSDGGWNVYGGTSASAPIIAGVYALAGSPVADTYPASYPYLSPGALNDVTEGDDASCPDSSLCGFGSTPECTPSYECIAGPGYDGPTGLGTPQGVAAFRPGPHGTLGGTVTNSSTGKPVPGATVTLGQYRATTDADGRYHLAVPVGSYPLSVSAFGYGDQSLGTVDLADGAALTKDIPLVEVATQTISGTVKDGGGHGWGVYAKITVDGVPGSVFTDPKTGHYAVKVPMDHTYTLRAAALYPGYEPGTATVAVAGSSKTADIGLTLTGTGALPPGYAITYHGGGLQSFVSSSTPGGWTVKNNTDAGGWQFDDPLNRGNQTGGDGRFAIVDDYALGWAPADTELISPSYDFSKEARPELDFDTALPPLYRLDDLTADVDVSTDDGRNWTNVWHHTDVVNGPSHEVVPLTAYAGESGVRVRFHFVGGLTGIWQLDNVAVGTRTLDTLPGGLLVGQITDSNTGAGVLGATVESVTVPSDSGHSVASPGDPAIGDGLYWAFSSRTGKQQFTAGLAGFGYPEVTTKVKIAADAVTAADIALHPAQLRVNETAVGRDVKWGDQGTVKVTVKNTGGSPATVSLGEKGLGGPVSKAAGAARHRVRTELTPNTATGRSTGAAKATGTKTDQAWQAVADLPGGAYGGLAAVNDGVLYAGLGQTPDGQWNKGFFSYDPTTGGWKKLADAVTGRFAPAYGFIRGKLYVTGGKDAAGIPIPGGDVYDPATDNWSQIANAPIAYGSAGSAVLGDKLYVIGGCDQLNCGFEDVQIYDPASDRWSTGKPYPRPVSYGSCATTDGVLYCAGGAYQPNGRLPTDTAAGYALDAKTGDWKKIADAPIDFWGATGTAANGRLLISGGSVISAQALTNEAYAYDPAADAWSALPNLANPLINAVSAPGWYVIGGRNAAGATQTAAQKLAGYDQPHADVPWLTESTKSVTVKAGASATVKVTLDASAMGPADAGDHRAALVVDSDTPYGAVTVPITMTVTAPAGWGLLTGTVTGTGTDGEVTPLAGATVQIDTKNGDYTLSTGTDGGYQLWLPAKDNPLTVIVAASGYKPTTRTVRIVKDGVVTSDFSLAHL
ncbi:carboxypeptidase regulatory-like domain-containing protein [Streptomyces sp. AK02-01A]|uniref:carboxypeptidase regulatory-like domain-containing protein n=1 Tax=Streptomyces sp. AK02-01A TaxID=3028648 RepID=UPI0029B2FF1B|nr:carboxypeptidase regulatory-like domain-containing protein [Streptomyces sp. AK02-01A]MDX3850195.1 carboxypeptidase regulatory-like domain-containing protein [Streptomyces sp. AK02-01A]